MPLIFQCNLYLFFSSSLYIFWQVQFIFWKKMVHACIYANIYNAYIVIKVTLLQQGRSAKQTIIPHIKCVTGTGISHQLLPFKGAVLLMNVSPHSLIMGHWNLWNLSPCLVSIFYVCVIFCAYPNGQIHFACGCNYFTALNK